MGVSVLCTTAERPHLITALEEIQSLGTVRAKDGRTREETKESIEK